MKVTVISSNDKGGGGLAASRLHSGLLAAGVDSSFFCRSASLSLSSQVRFEPPRGKIAALNRFVRKWRKQHFEAKAVRERSTLWGADHISRFGSSSVDQIPDADIWNLHSVFDLFDYDAFFKKLSTNTPIVWTLHQMNAFTGGCNYSQGCRRFEQNCCQCPYLKPTGNFHNAAHQIWQSKKLAYSRIPQHQLLIVSPSSWLASCASESSLLGGRAIHVIPNGIDLSLFKPLPQELARNILGISQDANVVLFVSQYDRSAKIKGFVHLESAISMLSGFKNLVCLSVGPASGNTHIAGAPLVEAGALEQQWMMPLIYSAADLLVVPSLEDNFPNVILEAAACELPVVGTKVGGIPEMIEHGLTGLIATSTDPESIANSIKTILCNPETKMQMGKSARIRCSNNFSIQRQVQRYQELYTAALLGMRNSHQ